MNPKWSVILTSQTHKVVTAQQKAILHVQDSTVDFKHNDKQLPVNFTPKTQRNNVNS